jgi:hypothetical protein
MVWHAELIVIFQARKMPEPTLIQPAENQIAICLHGQQRPGVGLFAVCEAESIFTEG